MSKPVQRTPAEVNAHYPGIFGLFGNFTDKAIGEHFGRTRKAISAIRNTYGIPAGEPASADLLRRAALPVKTPAKPKREASPSATHGGWRPANMVHESDTSMYLGMEVTVFIWSHTLLSDPKPWRIAIETPNGFEHRPCEDADLCVTMGEAMARAWWHCDRMAEGVAA